MNGGSLHISYKPRFWNISERIPGSGTTLSLEILSAENGLGSLVEAAFSFRIYPYIRSYDISKCYQQVRSAGKFIFSSLNIWFNDIENQKDPVVLARESLSFGNPVSGTIIELLIYVFVYEFDTDKMKEVISAARYSDNLNPGEFKMHELNFMCIHPYTGLPDVV